MSQEALSLLLFTPLFLFIVVVGICFARNVQFNVPREQAIRVSIATVIGYSVLAAIIIESCGIDHASKEKAVASTNTECAITLGDDQALVIYNLDETEGDSSRLKIEDGYAIMFGERQQ